MNRLDVQTSRMQPVMAAILGVIMVPLGLLSLYGGVKDGIEVGPLGIGVLMLATFGGVMWLGRRGHSRSVRYFSDEGLERNDGQWLAWSDLQRVVDQVRPDPGRPDQLQLWRTEIEFKSGEKAWLLPTRIANRGEVTAFVRGLPCEYTQTRV
ncbi:MAG TPA: hypothetical protein VF647_12715 [Longimicrobium sp.]|jgi:hypothetical protein